jgi:hypothetical protein
LLFPWTNGTQQGIHLIFSKTAKREGTHRVRVRWVDIFSVYKIFFFFNRKPWHECLWCTRRGANRSITRRLFTLGIPYETNKNLKGNFNKSIAYFTVRQKTYDKGKSYFYCFDSCVLKIAFFSFCSL